MSLSPKGIRDSILRADDVQAFVSHVTQADDAPKGYRSKSELQGWIVCSCRVSEIQPDDVEQRDAQVPEEDEPILEDEGSCGVHAHELDRLFVDWRQSEQHDHEHEREHEDGAVTTNPRSRFLERIVHVRKRVRAFQAVSMMKLCPRSLARFGIPARRSNVT